MQDQITLDGDKTDNSLIVEILKALPYTAVVLNKSREIIFSNQVSLDSNMDISVNEFIGKRPGEAFNCFHFNNSAEACGDTPKCKFCGTANVIVKSQVTKEKQTQESRFTRSFNGLEYSFEFRVSASPFKWEDKDYTLLTMIDISDQVRKKALEHIFFHDILNKTGSLSGFFQLIKDKDNIGKREELLEIAETISTDLNDEIISQRVMMTAESGELIIEKSSAFSKEIIKIIIAQLSNYSIFKNHQIEIDKACENILLNTDIILLKRILVNMLKNALEASEENEKITIGCKQKGKDFRFFVHNIKSIPEQTQLQIFQRSFSTKSFDRGLGTYSMKLLGERYLKGKVHFVSDEISGTTFYFDIPFEN